MIVKKVVVFLVKKGIFLRLDKKIRDLGVNHCLLALVNYLGGQPVVKISRKTRKVLLSRPVVVVANHPGEIDPLLLGAVLPARTDINLIIDATFAGWLSSLRRYLIPVWIQNNIEAEGRRTWKERLLVRAGVVDQLSEEEEKRRNIQSLRLASSRLEKGGVVVIFPAGKEGWYSGVGHVIGGVINRPVWVVMVQIIGTSRWDLIRLVPGIGKVLPKFKVKFSEPLLIEKRNPRRLTGFLEERYYSWLADGEA